VDGNVPNIPLDVFATGDLQTGYRKALDATVALMTADLVVHRAAAKKL
jgi:hypothetical protein